MQNTPPAPFRRAIDALLNCRRSAREETSAHRQFSDGLLEDLAESVGFCQDTHADEAFVQPKSFVRRHGLAAGFREHSRGDEIRDWLAESAECILFPYDPSLEQWSAIPKEPAWAWFYSLRPVLEARRTFSGDTYKTARRPWFDYHQFPKQRLQAPLSIAFAEVATHNHFVLDRRTTIFNRTAPVIKLRAPAEAEHLALLGFLNSALACFWLRQVCHDKGAGGIGGGIASELWEHRFAFNAANIQRLPVPLNLPERLAKELDGLSAELSTSLPEQAISSWNTSARPLPQVLSEHRSAHARHLGRMIALQEELDWVCYQALDLVTDVCHSDSAPPPLQLGERAFEIVMARKIATGSLQTTWFQRNGAVPIAGVPAHWPEEYRRTVERRIEFIESGSDVRLIEQPEFKRRWNLEPWDKRLGRALRDWLLTRLEASPMWSGVDLTSVSKLADRARRDPEFMQVAELYRQRADFDVTSLVAELVESDAVPFLPVLRYRPSGLRKRAVWEQAWDLQRRQNTNGNVGEIPVPPSYSSADFLDSACWSLRGKLDVPKERFVSYPDAEREADQSLVVGWAGWNHLQQARALAAYYVRMKEQEGWAPDRLKSLLAGLLELIPWLKQWHNDLDPAYGIGMGDYFAGFVDEEARALGFTVDDVRAWQPPARNSRRRRRASV